MWVSIEFKDLGKDGDVMRNSSTEEYRRREGDEDDVVDQPGEKTGDRTEGEADGKVKALVDVYRDKLKAKDPALFSEMKPSSAGELHHSEASWLTQPHSNPTEEDGSGGYGLIPESSAGVIFNSVRETFGSPPYGESGWTELGKAVDAVVNDLMGPTNRAMEQLEPVLPRGSVFQIGSVAQGLVERREILKDRFRDALHPGKGGSVDDYCYRLQDLKELSGDLRMVEGHPGSAVGFAVELGSRDSDLAAELDSMSFLKRGWNPEKGEWGGPDVNLDEVLLTTSWLRDSDRDDVIWESFGKVREDLSEVYCRDTSRELARLLWQPFYDERGIVERKRVEPDCLRDKEFGRPDLTGIESYFKDRVESGKGRAVRSLYYGDRDGFDQSMEELRDSCGELRSARAGYLPFHPNGGGLDRWVLEDLEKADRDAALDTEMGVYLVVSLSGCGAQSEVPAWNEEMKSLFGEYYHPEPMGDFSDGHVVDHDWPWKSENFKNLKYDELVVNPEFLKTFEEVTGGMLQGEQERLVRYIAERVVVDDDPEGLYKGLLYGAGRPRIPG